MNRLRTLWYLAIALAVLSSTVIALQRSADDERYLSVEICAEFESAAANSEQLSYESLEAYLVALRESGVVSVAVGETSLSDIVAERGLSVFTGLELRDRDALTPVLFAPVRELIDSGMVHSESLYVLPGDSELASLLSRTLSVSSLEPVAVKLHGSGDQSVIEISGNPYDIWEARFGLRGGQVRLALGAGLRVVPRLANPRSASAEAIDLSLEPLGSIRDLSPVIFSGVEVLGYPDNLDYVATRFREIGILPAIVEFYVQRGDRTLAPLLDYEIVRVHSITPGEYPSLSRQDMLDRLSRAVSERNVRVLYLRPHLIQSRLADGTALDFISSLRYRLESDGYTVGPAKSYPSQEPGMLRTLLPVMAAGAIALGLVVVDYVYPMGIAAQIVATCLAVAVVAIAALQDLFITRLLLSLAVAVMVPSLAALVGLIRAKQLSEARAIRPIVSALHAWLAAYLVAIAGGMAVAGILSDRSFFVKVTQFLGVKASHTLPFALAGGLVWWHRYGEDYVGGRLRVSKSLYQVLRAPVRVWHIIAAVVLLGGFLVYLGRTGNTFFIDLPVIDRRLRDAFETFLPVRPRTKEVFVGHPILVASLYAYVKSRGRCQYSLMGVVFGVVGLISIVNSFAHLHTPLSLTLMRVLMGAVVSIPVSLVAVLCVATLMSERSCGLDSPGVAGDDNAHCSEAKE